MGKFIFRLELGKCLKGVRGWLAVFGGVFEGMVILLS